MLYPCWRIKISLTCIYEPGCKRKKKKVVKLFMFVPANQINRSSLFCSESKRSRSKAERWFTWLLCMLTPTWHYVAGDMRLPQVAASPPPRDLPSILWKTSDARCERQTENKKKATNSWKKKNQTEEEGENTQGAETRGFDTLIQSQRSWANTAVGVVLLSGMLWQRFGFAGQGARAGTQGSHRNPAGPSLPAWEPDALS